MRKQVKLALVAAALVALGTAAYAALIGVQGQTRYPRIRYTGAIGYSTATQNLQISGSPTTVELVGGLLRNITDPRSVSSGVHFLYPQGTSYEGIGPNALYVEGTADLNGDGVIG